MEGGCGSPGAHLPIHPVPPWLLLLGEAPAVKEADVTAAHTYTVIPRIPDRLKDLLRIAKNYWWSWDPEAVDLFRRLEPRQLLWEKCYANPIRMLGLVSQERLAELTADDGFLAHMDRVAMRLSSYMRGGRGLRRRTPSPRCRWPTSARSSASSRGCACIPAGWGSWPGIT
ncbi:MAG TPA: DUF3417 domain-containing protein [Candidatus Methylomirabilis sp.]